MGVCLVVEIVVESIDNHLALVFVTNTNECISNIFFIFFIFLYFWIGRLLLWGSVFGYVDSVL